VIAGSAHQESLGTLLAEAQHGDRDAYRRFLDGAMPLLRRVAARRAGAGPDLEDIVQDALLTIHRVRHTYTPGLPAEPWLAAIAARRAIDSLRSRGRIGARELHDPLALETFADPQANREEAGGASRDLDRMMADLTPRQKEALKLVKLKQMSLAEASLVSGQSIASLKVNVHRGIKAMARKLGA